MGSALTSDVPPGEAIRLRPRYGTDVLVVVVGDVCDVEVLGGTEVVVDVDVVVEPPKPDPAGAPMAGAGPGAGAGARVVAGTPPPPVVVRAGVVEPVGVKLVLGDPAAAVTGLGPDASGDVVADVVVPCELRAGAEPEDVASKPTTRPAATSAAMAMLSAGRPRTTDHTARGCTMAQA